MSGDNGRAAVLGEALNGVDGVIASARAAADGEELELFPLPGARAGEAAAVRAIEAGKRGRPPGAVNKSTAELRKYLLARGVNPLQAMMQWALHTPESLANELGCTRLEAFDRLRALWEGLAPYFVPKMVPVDDAGRPIPVMLMQVGQFGAPKEAGGVAPWLYMEGEQNQALSAELGAVSNDAPSNDEQKA